MHAHARRYGVDVSFEMVSYTGARWALAGWDAVDEASDANNCADKTRRQSGERR